MRPDPNGGSGQRVVCAGSRISCACGTEKSRERSSPPLCTTVGWAGRSSLARLSRSPDRPNREGAGLGPTPVPPQLRLRPINRSSVSHQPVLSGAVGPVGPAEAAGSRRTSVAGRSRGGSGGAGGATAAAASSRGVAVAARKVEAAERARLPPRSLGRMTQVGPLAPFNRRRRDAWSCPCARPWYGRAAGRPRRARSRAWWPRS